MAERISDVEKIGFEDSHQVEDAVLALASDERVNPFTLEEQRSIIWRIYSPCPHSWLPLYDQFGQQNQSWGSFCYAANISFSWLSSSKVTSRPRFLF